MAAHSHTCWKCGAEFPCSAPIVRDSESPHNICIIAFEEGEDGLTCEDCESAQGEMQSERRLVQ